MPELHVFVNDGTDWNTEITANIEVPLTDTGAARVADGLRDALRDATGNPGWNVYEIATVERRAVPYTA